MCPVSCSQDLGICMPEGISVVHAPKTRTGSGSLSHQLSNKGHSLEDLEDMVGVNQRPHIPSS